jgi:CheY-like chemotaxis protein
MAEPLTGLRVLVVEDHSDSRDVLDQALSFMGAIVITVATAEDALSDLDRADVVITDFALPGKDGAWLLDRVKASRRPVPVILVSGFAATQVPAVAHAEFALKLLKPIDPWDLAREIVTLLDRR